MLKSRVADVLNDLIVTDSESDNPEYYVNITSLVDERTKKIVERKQRALKRKPRRQKAKAIASQNFLSRKISKRIGRILDKFPDIGKTIESFVTDSNVGADAWRRTGVLTDSCWKRCINHSY